MEFVFETTYNKKALEDMAKSMRKTVRKKSTKRSNVMMLIIIILTILITLPSIKNPEEIKPIFVFDWIVVVLLIIVWFFQDKINAYVASKKMIKGSEKAKCTFKEEVYVSDAQIGKTEFKYDCILEIAETENYFIFLLDKIHAQAYDKNMFSGGTVDEFRKFIEEKTNIKVKKVK